MATITNIIITSNDDITSALRVDTLSPQESVQRVATYMDRIAGGCGSASVDMQVAEAGGAAASGTITLSSLANNDTITVASQVFTAKTSGASGANQFNLGADDTAAAAAAAAAINAHASLAGVVTATSALAVITVSAAKKLAMGNQIGIAISAHGSVSGAKLTGGVNPTSNLMHFGL